MNDLVPEGWTNYRIRDVADTSDRYSFTGGPFGSDLKSEDYTNNGVRIIQLQNIGDGHFKNKYKIYTSEEKADALHSCNIYPGDIILSKMGDPVARAVIIPSISNRYLMASDGIRLSINKSRFDTKFVHDMINSVPFRNQAEMNSTGSTRKRIGLTQLRELEFICPPLPEQQKIAKILTSVDDVIEKTQAQIDKLKDLKTGMMQELLTRGVGVDGKPHTEFKDSPVGRIPVGWEVVTFGSITLESAFGPRFSSNEYALDGNIGCIRTTDMDENWDIDYSTTPRARLKFEEFEKHFLEDGDLLVTRSGTCGLVDVFKKQSIPMVAAAFLIRFRLNETVNPYFIRYLMMSSDIQEKIQNLASGGVQKNLSGTNLKTLALPKPDINEQNKIVEIIESINRRLLAAKIKQHSNKNLKKALMQDLLTGKVRVKVDSQP
ncbi:restriction endonuclease subunit S [Enterovibrio norvegicus]|uniref:restriction endonuclease subunit S n=1 Tax=Enterovibrio norvegicus TaxID=188144 RepID=UPI00352C72C8